MLDPEPIGPRLRRLRDAAGLTQAQLAAKIDRTQSYVAQVETGHRPASLELLHEIAAALGLDPHDLDPRLASNRGDASGRA